MTSTPTACRPSRAARARSRRSSDAGHDPNANIFTSIVATYTDKGNGAAQALTGQDDAVLHTRRKRAEHNNGTGRVAGSTAGGDPGVQEEATQDAGGGNNIGFIENGDYVFFNRINFKDINRIDFRVASGGAGGKIELRMDSPTGATFASVGRGADRRLAELDDGLDAADQRAGGHARAVPRVHAPDRSAAGCSTSTGSRSTARAPRSRAPPDVTATATPDTGQAPLTVAVQRDGDRPRGRGADLPVGLRRHRHHDRHLDAGGPDLHLRQRRHLHGEGHRDRRLGHQEHARRSPCASPARRTSARPERQVRRVQRHGARHSTAGRVQRSAEQLQVAQRRASSCRSTTARSTRAARAPRTSSPSRRRAACGPSPSKVRGRPRSTRTTSRPACGCTPTTTTGRRCT